MAAGSLRPRAEGQELQLPGRVSWSAAKRVHSASQPATSGESRKASHSLLNRPSGGNLSQARRRNFPFQSLALAKSTAPSRGGGACSSSLAAQRPSSTTRSGEMRSGFPAKAEVAPYGESWLPVGCNGSTCQSDCPADSAHSKNRTADGPKSPTESGPGRLVTWSSRPAERTAMIEVEP